ncbi:MAG TPA: PBP1A family penicillin-binding protein, partial [Thermoanaerobaculia bacterium]|nr:PBP1A family penicillin-binding protein [Thermoanaerobaculia bacterium]
MAGPNVPRSPPQPDPAPANPTPRLSRRGKIVRGISVAVIVVGLLTILIAGYVYYQAIKTFEVRRVSLPTRVFTDAVPLRTGAEMTANRVLEKLQRLGYRESDDPQQAGDYASVDGGLSIFLRSFQYPGGRREAQKVVVTFDEGRIQSVIGSDGAATAGEPAIEPELLTSIFGDTLENRRPATLDQIPQHVVDAVVVTEDVRFFQHPGVDPVGIVRALFRNVRAGEVEEGGSTLTQQLVKNYYLTNERTFRRKAVEAFMSVILDAKYSKREIIEAYLNDIYLGRNRSISILGVGEAARFYFGKPISEVTPGEAAMLAGMIRSPNNLSPFENPERARTRRDTVLKSMLSNGKLTQEQYAEAIAEDLPEKPTRSRGGLASIPFYVDRVTQELRDDYGIADVKGRGLSIYTAIDLDWQNAAATQLEEGLGRLEKSNRRLRREVPIEGAIIAVDVPSGEIRALVGGRNYTRSQFNRALNAKRQVGSLFKPFVVLAAFEPSLSNQNITPATLINDERFVLERRFSKDWSPRNYNNHYEGVVTVRRALVLSLNSAMVRLGLAAGVDAVLQTARVLGVREEIDSNPAVILGSTGIPPIQMADSYATIARMGSRTPLRAVKFVTDDGGDVIASSEGVEAVQVFPARNVYLTVDIMKGVLNGGTGSRARSLGFRKTAAGKTGTTNDGRDAWFIGFTPQTLALTWIGFDDNAPVGVSASEGAVPIWARYMNEITNGRPDLDFPAPAGLVAVQMDEISGGLATPLCPSNVVVTQTFKAGTQPATLCQTHVPPPEPLPIDPYAISPYGDPPMDPYGTTTDPVLG